MKPTKFCKDCKYFKEGNDSHGITPIRPSCMKTESHNLVTGELMRQPCYVVRDNARLCGTDGRWFEPKVCSET